MEADIGGRALGLYLASQYKTRETDDDRDLTDEEMADGMAQFDAWFPNDMKAKG